MAALRSPQSAASTIVRVLHSTLFRSSFSTSSVAAGSLRVGLLVKRNPVVLRELSEFESSYYTYRDARERGESRLFNSEFYFKKGTVAEARFQEGSAVAESESQKRLASGVAGLAPLEIEDPDLKNLKKADRVTDVDHTGNLQSLNRQLHRTLYLVVKDPSVSEDKKGWKLPDGSVKDDESLKQAAERHAEETCGGDIELWVVGNAPVGHHIQANSDKIFFMKGHIISGNVEINKRIASNHAWLTKQELKDYLAPDYFASVSRMMSEL
ncbi:uncharacterized protein BJ171DRAFT_524380 [Polychytrium aggregatum]|uniref:uncharacterized protein n=1 Tax=Polychytrium aggregatum TaxID=110093 RepID=UPI0022FF1B83|nr:uncharacterized protein BJ171DRAFT_524380 [Polychytrium aggregatum]KAI9193740.1 hypothetical protein BJ171DRAFT_524380 [Polychytrium aggregatum]